MGDDFTSVWERHSRPTARAARTVPRCIYAEQFGAWTEELCASVEAQPSVPAINVAKLLLQERYMAWFEAVPKPHRTHLSNAAHECIFAVFRGAFQRLKVTELTLSPPPFPPPSAPPPPAVAGIYIGEDDAQ